MRTTLLIAAIMWLGCGDSASNDVPLDASGAASGDSAIEDTKTADPPAPDAESDRAAAPRVQVKNATLIDNPKNVLSVIVSFNTREAVRAQIHFSRPDGAAAKTGISPQNTQHAIVVVGMRADTEYTLQIVLPDEGIEGPTLNWTSGPLPDGVPKFEFTAHVPEKVSPGVTLFGVEDGSTAVNTQVSNKPLYIGVDEAGYVVWYYADPEAAARNDRQAQVLKNGHILLALQKSFRVVDLAGNTVVEFGAGPPVGGGVHHDAVRLPDLSYIVLGRITKTIDGKKLRGDRLVQVDAGATQKLWDWSCFDHLDTSYMPGPLSQKAGKKDGAHDWTHANGLVYRAASQSVMVSLRHHNQIVNIDHQSGDLLWKLGQDGDFELKSGSWFYSQHSPDWLSDNRVLVYDNGNERPRAKKYSRAVLYKIDESAMTAEQVWEFKTDHYTSFLGSARGLENGNILVCAGGYNAKLGGIAGPPQPGMAQIVEVTPDENAQKVWEITTLGFVFRATRSPSFWIQ
jgi:hypothetical protein